jgi:hypothetical protein
MPYLPFPLQDGDTTIEIEPEGESHTTVDSAVLQEIDRDALMGNFDEVTNVEALLSDPSTELTPKIEIAIKAKWQKIVGPEIEIVVRLLYGSYNKHSRIFRHSPAN